VTGGRRQYPRTARLNESVLEVLADELERMSDPRLELVTLTGVDVSRDLAHATVYFSTLAAETGGAPESFADEAAAGLASGAAHLQGAIGRQLRIRQVPRLVFKVDPGIVSGQRIEEILRDIHQQETAADEAGAAGGSREEEE
jgi:ribosome-binding factor A